MIAHSDSADSEFDLGLMTETTSSMEKRFRRITRLSPGGYVGAFRLRFSRPLLYKFTYDEDWMNYYGDKNFAFCDPTIIWGLSNNGWARWSQIKIPDPFQVLEKAKDFGLNYGVVFSHGPFSARSIMGCARDDREFTEHEISDLNEQFVGIHNDLSDQTPLSAPQVEALRLYSYGYDYGEIEEAIGISRTALKSRLVGARKRLGARSNVDAVRIATERAILEPHPYGGMLGQG